MSSTGHGYLDSNIVIHAFSQDAQSEECRQLLNAIREGAVTAIIEPMVLHELTYSLPKYAKQLSRGDIADHLESILLFRGISGDKSALLAALQLWRQHPSIGFVDCFLAVRAIEQNSEVFTMNVRHLRRLGANTPEPLPHG